MRRGAGQSVMSNGLRAIAVEFQKIETPGHRRGEERDEEEEIIQPRTCPYM